MDLFSVQANRVLLVAVVQKGTLYTKAGSGIVVSIDGQLKSCIDTTQGVGSY